ncbi:MULTISPECIES: hypothetical protein [Pseudoalteromonas]|uniref:Uncharacterized protein n=1 Tax=Pseudoalteromonas rubra TaxID=43658 RepID=A0A0F4QTF1_9GAMM|nr:MULTISPECIES: hypothetical protein [Pseudoalteromonas]KJZ10634.1 hypothetical protein TW77_07065 [Pseudoalteromonas rubra]MCF2906802.1 hypothetical protein [Pseudoalteromonas sp. DL2-H2.2]MEC4088966.1 hypothetical protein [Pseudoalteromonas rubra]
MDINQPICDFGLHSGEPYCKLPASFLNWMVATGHAKQALAKDELTRRHNAVCDSRMKSKVQ